MPYTEYRLVVEDASIEGHPIQKISNNLTALTVEFDKYKEKYPYNNIKLYAKTEAILFQHAARCRPLPQRCPRGHEGEVDKKPIIVETLKNTYQCKVCGDIFNHKGTYL